MTLYGKGYYLWKIPYVEKGNPVAITERALEAGLSHMLIKVADGDNWPYNVERESGVDLIPPLRDLLWEAGLQVWGWHYVRGDNPIGEARLAIERMKALNLDGYVVDAEEEYKQPGKSLAAKRFMRELRAEFPDLPMALSTYRYPHLHRTFPFETFLESCDYAMPQVYFEQAHNPESQLERCVDQYLAFRPARPILPTGPTYSHAGWTPTGEDVTRFLARAKEMGLGAANFWAIDFSLRDSMKDLWHAVATFHWTASPPVADVPERLVGRINQHDPSFVAGLYHENAAHVTGARTVIGKEPIQAWYQAMFNQLLPNLEMQITGKSGSGNSRHFTWTAEGKDGVVLDGNDTLGLRDGLIQYHYTYFTIT